MSGVQPQLQKMGGGLLCVASFYILSITATILNASYKTWTNWGRMNGINKRNIWLKQCVLVHER